MSDYYRKFSEYLKMRYGTRVQKIAVHTGFTCPNRDGSKGTGGCIFCNNAAFSPASRSLLPLETQIEQQMDYYRQRRKTEKFFLYFQSYSNTHAAPEQLKSIYDVAYQFPDLVALAVGTRPDCLSPAILDLLESYSADFDVWVEYGLESAHNRTLDLINRCHSYEDFDQALTWTRTRKLLICVHLILGLPGETGADMLTTAALIAKSGVHAVKLHPIQVIRDTALAQMYAAGQFTPMSLEAYAAGVCDFLERLPPEMIIQRLSADAPADYLLAPLWCLEKQKLLQTVELIFSQRGSRQGACWPR